MFNRDESRYHGFDLPWWLKIALLPVAAGVAVKEGIRNVAKKLKGKKK